MTFDEAMTRLFARRNPPATLGGSRPSHAEMLADALDAYGRQRSTGSPVGGWGSSAQLPSQNPPRYTADPGAPNAAWRPSSINHRNALAEVVENWRPAQTGTDASGGADATSPNALALPDASSPTLQSPAAENVDQVSLNPPQALSSPLVGMEGVASLRQLAQVSAFNDELSKVVQAIKAHGTPGQQAALAGTSQFLLHTNDLAPKPPPGQSRGAVTFDRESNSDGSVGGVVSVWRPAFAEDPDIRELSAVHDIFHGDPQWSSLTAALRAAELRAPHGSPEVTALQQQLEQGVESEARQFMRANGLLPPAGEKPLGGYIREPVGP